MNSLKQLIGNRSLLLILCICIVNFLIRVPAATVPAYSDETIYFQNTYLIAHNNLNPFINQWGYKPPAMFMIPALFTHFVGQSMIWGRMEIFLLSSVALYFLYRLGERMFSAREGLYTVLLCLCFPLFTVQSNLFQDAIPFTAFFLASLYYYVSHKPISYAVATSLLVLTKEPGIFLPVLLIFFTLVSRHHAIESQSSFYIPFSLSLFLPIAVFLVWMVINKLTLGWFLWPYNVSIFSFALVVKNVQDTAVVHQYFFDNAIWMVFTTVFLGMIFLLKYSHKGITEKLRFMSLLVSLLVVYYLFYLGGPPTHRYILFLYPILFLLFTGTLSMFLPNLSVIFGIIMAMCAMFIGSLTYHSFLTPLKMFDEDSFSYMRTIRLTQKLIIKLQTTYRETYPLLPRFISNDVKDSYFGYVNTIIPNSPINTCDDFTDENSGNPLKIVKELRARAHTVLYVSIPEHALPRSCPFSKNMKYIESVCPNPASSEDDCFNIYTFSS